jgi:hypothetical protein
MQQKQEPPQSSKIFGDEDDLHDSEAQLLINTKEQRRKSRGKGEGVNKDGKQNQPSQNSNI